MMFHFLLIYLHFFFPLVRGQNHFNVEGQTPIHYIKNSKEITPYIYFWLSFWSWHYDTQTGKIPHHAIHKEPKHISKWMQYLMFHILQLNFTQNWTGNYKNIKLLLICLTLTWLQYFSAKQSSVSSNIWNNTLPQLSFLKERQQAYKINTLSVCMLCLI